MPWTFTPTQIFPGMRTVFLQFWPQIRKEKALILVSILGLVVEVFARLLGPWPLKLIFDYVLLPDAHTAELDLPFLRDASPTLLVLLLSLSIVATAALSSVSAYISIVSMSIAASRIITEIRSQLYAHLQRLSLAFHYQAKSGDLLTRITSDIDRLRDVTVNHALPLIINLLTLVSMVAVMFWMDWELALIALAVFPIFLLSTLKITKRIRQVAKRQRRRESAMAATAAESMGAIKVVQALSLENLLEQVFAHDNRKSLEESARTQQFSAGLKRTAEILVAIATALVLWRGVYLVQRGSATPGDLLVFITYLKTAFKPTRELAKQMAKITRGIVSAERVIDLLKVEPAVQDAKDAIIAPPFRGAISFRNVSFAYQIDQPILKDLNFKVQPGQRIALVGPSGGGKSTLVSLLLRLYDPQLGQILIDGQDLRDYQLESLRNQISIVLQDSILFGTSIRDNIAYGALGATDAEVRKAAQLANAHDFIMDLPNGYDTMMSERGVTLSGGQRQRVAIARAAIRKAPIVILDEPTVGLDNKSEQAVSEALNRLAQNSTTILITHDLSASRNFDQILYIESGQALEQGTHSELMQKGQHYAALYQLQSAVDTDHFSQSIEL
ncbi:Putative multidrug export ATP-binding/permease protein [Acaryochloris thomasi RCC1774]|uniref:Multidrug export ATP-binding/permease protein n=1 Tax=Acaryochloris thomasi RCC1774 TaxID=1764569 RepID=A0A2W1JPS7_9CYAN|nr:ABC transporter ATP-binding protein [Acaryochloris thomasi]PZD73425.1 Putative multidrug export ATP-binding/permease protein [Acaryochloris thomasi RCC1774]